MYRNDDALRTNEDDIDISDESIIPELPVFHNLELGTDAHGLLVVIPDDARPADRVLLVETLEQCILSEVGGNSFWLVSSNSVCPPFQNFSQSGKSRNAVHGDHLPFRFGEDGAASKV